MTKNRHGGWRFTPGDNLLTDNHYFLLGAAHGARI
jgi:hypothetical protein